MFHVKHPPEADGGVSRETLARLQTFTDLLLRWNARINLISRADAAAVWTRHIDDSLQLAGLLPPDTLRAVDLGSGAGFPGLVLTIATGIPFDLIESDQRKASFLREAARVCSAPATVHAVRIENAKIPPATLVTARALAPLPTLLEMASRFMRPDGVALFLKGAEADRELTEARRTWNMRVESFGSRTAAEGTIFRLSEVKRG
jgi:16S rRNA (guanine527-N7)-methyltransferase